MSSLHHSQKLKTKQNKKRGSKLLAKFIVFQLILVTSLSVWLKILDLNSPLIPSSFATTFTDYWPHYGWFDYDYFVRLLDLSLQTAFLLFLLYFSITNIFLPKIAGNDALIPSISNYYNIFDKHRYSVIFCLVLVSLVEVLKRLPVILYPFLDFLFSELDSDKAEYQFWRWFLDASSLFLLLILLCSLIHYLRNGHRLQNRAGAEPA